MTPSCGLEIPPACYQGEILEVQELMKMSGSIIVYVFSSCGGCPAGARSVEQVCLMYIMLFSYQGLPSAQPGAISLDPC